MKTLITFYYLILIFVLNGCSSDDAQPVEDEGTVYFLISETVAPQEESFILALTDPDHIGHARKIIEDPDNEQLAKLVTAKVVKQETTASLANRDLLNDRIWTWKVEEFQAFADQTIEILDGRPSDVEKDFWFENSGGVANEYGFIGFWGYTVKREVSVEELRD